VSQADAEQRHLIWNSAREVPDQFDADASFPRSTGSGRNHYALGMHRFDLPDGHFVVAADLDPCAQFSQVLNKVVSERIVVIEDEDHKFIVAVKKPGFRVTRFLGFKEKSKSCAIRAVTNP
jgi:hypothetical protein